MEPPSAAGYLRRARRSDATSIANLYLASRRGAMPWIREVHSDDDVRRWVADVLIASGSVWVVELGGRIAGLAAIANGWVDQLYVHPDRQGQRIGSLLLDHAKALSPTGLQLWAFQRNIAARAFYEARGFVAVEFTDGSGNEEQEPDVRYAWQPVRTGRQGAVGSIAERR